MSRTDNWRVIVREDRAQARVMLLDERSATLGTATMAWSEYQQLVRRVAGIVMASCNATISASLGKKIWHEARLGSDNSEEIAMKRLTDLGFTQETWDRIALQLAQEIVARMTVHLPEHRG